MKNSIVFKLSRVLLLVVGLGLMSASSLFAQSTNTYEYDNLNRLIKTTYGNGAVVQYTYDAVGNRTAKIVNGVSVIYTITATANPSNGGGVSGSGTYQSGSNCVLTATPNSGYTFINWTENGSQVSSNPTYSFTVAGDRSLVANFILSSSEDGRLNGVFSVSENLQVNFSQGNLQYQASTNTWRFAPNQWDNIGTDNANISETYSGWIDLFGWGTSGYDHGAVCYQPWSVNTAQSNYYAYGAFYNDLYEFSGRADWGYNSISNGGNQENLGWRTLTKEEWSYIFNTRNTSSGVRFVKAKVNGNNGVILLPDNWSASTYNLTNANSGEADYSSNTINLSDWSVLFEANGAVFLPANGYRSGTTISGVDENGSYWSATNANKNNVYRVDFKTSSLTQSNKMNRYRGVGVRLAIPVEGTTFNVTSSPNNVAYGTVNGSGTYLDGLTCTMSATPNEGYVFVNWTEAGKEISTEPIYSFVARRDRTLVANFTSMNGTGKLNGLFSVGGNTQVCFSQGNLQYRASTNTWRFAINQYDFVGWDNGNISETYNGWIDLFGWGTSGYNHGAVCYQPWSTGTSNSDYYAYGASENNLYDQTGQADWGYNAISNGGNTENSGWRTLTKDEWEYVFNTRTTSSGIRFALACVNGINGIVLLPDNWNNSTYSLSNTNESGADFSSNIISMADWSNILEVNGAVFLSAAGYRGEGADIQSVGSDGLYWSSVSSGSLSKCVYFWNNSLSIGSGNNRSDGLSVRLVTASLTFSINTTSNPPEGGIVTGGGIFQEGETCTLTATPNSGYTFVNWTMNGAVVSANPTYSFTVNQNATYVANFTDGGPGITQTTVLPQGWTWWSTYVEQTGNNGLAQMEESLGSYGTLIKSQANGFVTNASGMWYGSLSGIANESTYMVQTSGACQMTVTGSAATPTAHPITLQTGWTWIGYPCSSPMSVGTAMSGLTPAANDQLKAQESFAVYTAGVGWLGSLQTVTPGMGLMFQSHSGTAVTLTYPNPTKTEELKENATTRGNHWTPEVTQYPDNMTMVAVVELDGEELRGERYELAAFAEGECRGSAELMYVAALDRYMAFMTLYGDSPAEMSFGLYDASTGEENYETNEIVPYSANATAGSPTEPCVVRFRGLTGVGELNAEVKVFPNPVRRGQTLSIGTADEEADVEIDIVNALGVVVGSNTSVKSPATIKAPNKAGVYILRITVNGKGTCYRRLVVN